MATIEICNLSFSYTDYYKPIFQNVNLMLDSSWKLGLIGRNGRGKTTFLRLIAGELLPDKGEIKKSISPRLFTSSTKWGDEMIALDVVKEQMGGLHTLECKLMHRGGQSEEEYLRCLEQYEFYSGYTAESDIQRECHKMELSSRILTNKFGCLSGGEQSKLLIIAEMLRKHHFVLFDEPTNHLDAQSRSSVAHYLAKKNGFIVVTHDRDFLDGVADHILAINKCDVELKKGNYSTWEYNAKLKTEYELATKKKLEEQIEKSEKDITRKGNWADALANKKYNFRTNSRSPDSREAKLRKAAKKSRLRMEKNIDVKRNLLKNFETTEPLWFQQQEMQSTTLLRVNSLSFSYGEYCALQDVSFELNRGERLWVYGFNGAGKTTLLKLLSGSLNGYLGTIWKQASTVISYCAQNPIFQDEEFVRDLDSQLFRQVRNFLNDFDMNIDVLDRPLVTWSSGELRKYQIARALASPNHILILDEPLNYMDVFFVGQLEKAILQVEPTLIFVDHDERFCQAVATKKLNLNHLGKAYVKDIHYKDNSNNTNQK